MLLQISQLPCKISVLSNSWLWELCIAQGHGGIKKTSNHYTSVPAPPTENPHVPWVVLSVERSVENYDNVPSLTSSSSSSDPNQPPASAGNPPIYSQVDVKPQPVPVDDKHVVYAKVMKTQGSNVSLSMLIVPHADTLTSRGRTTCTLYRIRKRVPETATLMIWPKSSTVRFVLTGSNDLCRQLVLIIYWQVIMD